VIETNDNKILSAGNKLQGFCVIETNDNKILSAGKKLQDFLRDRDDQK